MPGRHYRRTLRAKQSQPTQMFINLFVLPDVVQRQVGTTELEKIRSYFLTVLDMMIQYDSLQESIIYLQTILKSIQTQVEYYNILELIEENLLSVAINVSNSVNPKLIEARIHYIQSIIQTMPPICQERGPVSNLMLELIQIIIEGIEPSKIVCTIESIQSYIMKRYGNQPYIDTIQNNLLNIIDSIKNGTSYKLIEYRISYVKGLINDLTAETNLQSMDL